MHARAAAVILASAALSPALAPALAPAQTVVPPFQPGAVWNDTSGVPINAHGGSILFDAGMYYWFGAHMGAGASGLTAQVGVHVYASRDLYHWTDRGIALAVTDDPASDITRGAVIERPAVIRNARTGKFVMWFHLELKGKGYNSARSGVAVADAPAGPYRYLGSFRPNAGVWPRGATAADRQPGPGNYLARDVAGGQMARDMTLFVDDDGSAYQIYASEENRTLQISRLSDDYLKPAGDYVRVLPGQGNEAPAMFKAGGHYYLITSGETGWKPNAARLAVADKVRGPWTSLGNPVRGSEADQRTTFGAQGSFVLAVPQGFIFMADRWDPADPIDGRYVWLPVAWEGGLPVLRWLPHWSLGDLGR